MKARHQRNQNSPFAPWPHWQGKTSQSLRESWSTAPAATVSIATTPHASVVHPKMPAREITREEMPAHASNELVDLEALEQRFFAEGMSEDALAAASEREAELERQCEFGRTSASAGSKLLLGGAMCTALAVVVGGTLIRQLNASGASPLPLVTTQVVATPVAAPTPPPAPPPPAPVAQATPPSVVDVTALRAGTATAAAAAVAVAQPDPAAAAQSTPQDPQAACAQVLRRGRFREMNQWCAAAFAEAPSAELAGRMAEMALERGRHGDAAVWARRAIHHNPRFALAFVYLGGAEQELGHMDAARAAYNRYLTLAPEGQHADDVRALLSAHE
jgi:tetratricopeptide (TPR) repeat protein